MNLPGSEQKNKKNSRARSRRVKRKVIAALSHDERAIYIDEVASKASPSFDFFLFSLLAGAIIGFAYIIDSPYILLLGALTAPVMAPVIGLSLGTILGSSGHFIRSLGGMLISTVLLLLMGVLAGFVMRIWLPLDLVQVFYQAQLTWPPFLVISIGAIFTAATLVNDKHNPSIPSIALAYSLFLPLVASGFGLGSGLPNLWPDGFVLFLIHLAWTVLVGAITLRFMGFKPYTLFGYSIGGTLLLVTIVLIIGFGSLGAAFGNNYGLPTYTPTVTKPPTLTPSPSHTMAPSTATLKPSSTPTITHTPTSTSSPTPTPIEARLEVSDEYFGAYVRSEPNSDSNPVSSISNGGIVVILGERQVDSSGFAWLKILNLEDGVEGWILENLLVTATPLSP